MKLYKKLQNDMLIARRSKNTLEKTILSVIIGDVQLEALRNKKDISDDGVIKIIKKMKKSAEENIKYGYPEAKLEIPILERYLPIMLSLSETKDAILKIDGLKEELFNSPNPRKLTGMVIGSLKKIGHNIDGSIVGEAICLIVESL